MNLILFFLCPSQVKRTPRPQLPRAVGNVRLHGNQCLLHGTKDADLYPSSAQILDAVEEEKKKKDDVGGLYRKPFPSILFTTTGWLHHFDA